ncbi:class I SAM-dependent methyltransferase [bacterium]|nr:class I SAM-dependent methyltransferase [bacterium]
MWYGACITRRENERNTDERRLKMQVVATQQTRSREFVPMNDEYQPFPLRGRRNYLQSHLELPLMIKALKLPTEKRMLEIGCGQGNALSILSKICRPSRLVGIDIDAEVLRRAQKNLAGSGVEAELYLEDVRQLHFPDQSFDVIVDFGTCYHINHRVKALREITRVLSTGGVFVQETRFNQLLSHPVRSCGRRIPWRMVPALIRTRSTLFWSSRVKT